MARRKRGNPVNGWVVLDKPIDLNSTKAVSIVRAIFKAQKAGHAGTLDPLATGILPIALGEATKTVPYVMDGGKIYQFTVAWGAETKTDDLEGEVTNTSTNRPSREQIEAILPDFTGAIQQTPPAYSAIKINGQRAYDLARSGEEVAMKSREVQIYSLKLLPSTSENSSNFETKCGKGTYIRALGRDMGQKLGCLGHITALRRASTGPFNEEMSISLEKLRELGHSADDREALPNHPEIQVQQHLNQELQQHLYPIETALDDIPALAIDETQATRIRLGQSVLITGRDAPIIKGPVYTKLGSNPVALGSVVEGAFKPTRVFNLNT